MCIRMRMSRERMLTMKNFVIIHRAEVAAVNDVLGTYGSEKRISEIDVSRYGVKVYGIFDPEGDYLLDVKIEESLVMAICQIAINHAAPIKGIIKAISGLKDTMEYVARNVSRDLKDLFRGYEKDE